MRQEYDVFLSHKNLDGSGLPTRDSVLARELYDHLSGQALRVFLSAVSLEQLGAAAYKKSIDDALDSAQMTATTVDVLLRGVRVWLHVRSYLPGRHTTIPEHMPKAHRAHLEWSPSRLIGWGATIGRHTEALVQALLESRPHPEQGYRSCLGLLRLAKQHGADRLDAACARALAAGARSYRHVESILKHGLDRLPLDGEAAPSSARPLHANVRGPAYYDSLDAEGDHYAD